MSKLRTISRETKNMENWPASNFLSKQALQFIQKKTNLITSDDYTSIDIKKSIDGQSYVD